MNDVWFENVPFDPKEMLESLKQLAKECEGKQIARNLYSFENWQSALSFVTFAKQDLEEKFEYSTKIKITIKAK